MTLSKSILNYRFKTARIYVDGARFVVRTSNACISSVTGRVRFDFRQASTTSTATTPSDPAHDREYPKLVHVPSYPFVGSFIPQLSGTPKNIKQPYTYFPGMRQKFGDFYTMGMPGAGNQKDSHGTVHIFTDPREMVKIIRAGGSYPSGLVESLWVIKKVCVFIALISYLLVVPFYSLLNKKS